MSVHELPALADIGSAYERRCMWQHRWGLKARRCSV